MFSFFKQHHRKRLRSQPFPPSWLDIIHNNVPIYNHLPEADQRELQGHIRVFLAEKVFEGCGGLELTEEIKVTIAAQACLLLLHRENNCYPRLITILVYPNAYVAKSVELIGGGVVQEGETARLGEAWKDGVVVLSWDHVRRGASNTLDGHNVVLHEFAHQFDMENGSADGAPILDHRSQYVTWARVMSDEYEQFAGKPSRVSRVCSTNTGQPTLPSSSPSQKSASLRSRFRYDGSTRSFTRNSRSTIGKIQPPSCLPDG